ncbi:MAG: hypothetical protein ABR980_03385 [Ignavibacteriaceae bacterium]
MKRSMILFLMLFCLAGLKPVIYAQSKPILYFCEKYDADQGEIGISDRFTKGYLTIMVRADKALGLKNVFIQLDKYNWNTYKFEFYKKFNYTVDPDMKYIFFAKNDSSDLLFGEPGFYRVFLLNENNENVTSSLIEIIE